MKTEMENGGGWEPEQQGAWCLEITRDSGRDGQDIPRGDAEADDRVGLTRQPGESRREDGGEKCLGKYLCRGMTMLCYSTLYRCCRRGYHPFELASTQGRQRPPSRPTFNF